MGDWDDERGRRTSALGRVDWSCWLAAVGLLFVTVISVVVQFPLLGVFTAIIAVLLVVFDSWVNRPQGARAARRDPRRDRRWETGWSDVRRTGSRPQQAIRQPPPDYRTRQPQPRRQPQPQQPAQRQPRGNGQPARFAPGRGQQQPQRQGQPPRPAVGQPQRPNRAQPHGGQPNRATPGGQGQPPQRQPPPTPTRGREPDYRART